MTEPVDVTAELAAQYGAANFRRAALLLTVLDLTEAEEQPTPPATLPAWGRLVELGVAAHREAVALREAGALRRTLGHLRRIAALRPSTVDDDLGMGAFVAVSEAEAAVLVPLYDGVAARADGDLDRAEGLFDTALARARAADPAGMTVAIVLGTAGRSADAVPLVRALTDSGLLPPDLAASLFVRLHRSDLALPSIEQVERLGGPGESWRDWEWRAVHAEALLGIGRAAAALALADRAVVGVEQHLARLSRDVLRTMALDDYAVASVYTTAVRACARLHLAGPDPGSSFLARAFALSDRCRGVVLGELIDLDRAAGESPALVAAVRAWLAAGAGLGRTVEHLDAALDADPGTVGRPADVRRAVRAAERRLDDAEATVAGIAPTLLGSGGLRPATPVLAEVQERLEPGTVLVQYHAFDDELVGWVVGPDHARLVTVPVRTALLGAHVRRFVRALADPGSTPGDRATAAAPLQMLLDLFADELGEAARVVVVPHGPLAGLPFHALPFGDADLTARPRLRSVSYLPAASTALAPDGRDRRTGSGAAALVLGAPAYAPVRGLGALPGAAVEARSIAALRGVPPLVGPRAGGRAVREALAGARIAHLATHGLLREGAPYSAELPLAGEDSLTVPDLMGLDTTLDLAVLSACDSGRGRSTAAGDLIGLTRALLAAGTRELVVSLWPVDDQLACLTMVRFHRALLADDASPADALATAARGVRALDRPTADQEYETLRAATDGERPGGTRSARDLGPTREGSRRADPGHPCFWAPFVHVGLPSNGEHPTDSIG